jgi:hypothetical protein
MSSFVGGLCFLSLLKFRNMKPLARDMVLRNVGPVDNIPSHNDAPLHKASLSQSRDWESMSGGSSNSPSACTRSSSRYRGKGDEDDSDLADHLHDRAESPTSPMDVVIVAAPPPPSPLSLHHQQQQLSSTRVGDTRNSIATRARSSSSTLSSITATTSCISPVSNYCCGQSKVVHFVDPQSGVTFFKAKVPLPLTTATVSSASLPLQQQQQRSYSPGSATMKDLAKISLKRLVTKFQLSPSICSIRGMQILGNGASLSAADQVHAVVGLEEEVVFMTTISDDAARASVLSLAAAAVATSTTPSCGTASSLSQNSDMTQVLTSSQQQPQSQQRKREREEDEKRTTSRRVQKRAIAPSSSSSSVPAAAEVMAPEMFTEEEVHAAGRLVDTLISERCLANLFSHVQAARRASDLCSMAGRAR